MVQCIQCHDPKTNTMKTASVRGGPKKVNLNKKYDLTRSKNKWIHLAIDLMVSQIIWSATVFRFETEEIESKKNK